MAPAHEGLGSLWRRRMRSRQPVTPLAEPLASDGEFKKTIRWNLAAIFGLFLKNKKNADLIFLWKK